MQLQKEKLRKTLNKVNQPLEKKNLAIGDKLRHPNGTVWVIKEIYPNSLVVGIGADDLVVMPDLLLRDFRIHDEDLDEL